MRTLTSNLLGAATAAALVLTAPVPGAAATCADHPVQARGEPSRFEVLAKGKARGNWRSAVRAMPALGPLYANWSKALAADYTCAQGNDGYLCTAIGRPCRD